MMLSFSSLSSLQLPIPVRHLEDFADEREKDGEGMTTTSLSERT